MDEKNTTPASQPAPDVLRAVTAPAKHVLSAYSGEHGVYGVVLVTALIAVSGEEDSDLDVLLFVVGTVFVFWLAHIYAAVVASRATKPRVLLRTAIGRGIAHAYGMLISMLVPVALLAIGVVGWIDEEAAYDWALLSGVVVLAVIGFANATRNGSTWPWRIAGALSTSFLGILMIILSIIVH